jgi:N utilization substance protein B
MGIRRNARRIAVRILYIVEVLGISSREAWEIIELADSKSKEVDFAHKLVEGTLDKIEFLDGIIHKYTKNWEMDRIANVDKVIIRMGLYEIFYEESIPKNATINEAVELAKYYSTGKSHKFVNGILDSSTNEMEKKKK